MIVQLDRRKNNPWYEPRQSARQHAWMQAARSKGGQVSCAKSEMAARRSNGYWAMWDRHPEGLLWLKKKIRRWNQAKADEHNLSYEEWRWQRFKTLRCLYKRIERGGPSEVA